MSAGDKARKDTNNLLPREGIEIVPSRDQVNSLGEPGQVRRSIPITIFVIRVSGEWSSAGLQWRGRIEHLPSGQTMPFSTLEEISQFILSASR